MPWYSWLAVGYLLGIATGAVLMHIDHAKSVDRYITQALSEMRDEWFKRR